MAFVPTTPFPSTPSRQGSTVCMSATPRLSRRAALLSALALPLPALADHTYVAAKRSYERYYPRIEAGVATMRELGEVVKNGGSVKETVNGRLFDVGLRRALSIYATSFSDNYLGERSKELLRCVDRFYREMGKVEGEEGVLHFNAAVEALNDYFEVARLDRNVVKGLAI